MSDFPQAAALAWQAADAIRSLNHAALGPDGIGQPGDAYDVLGGLSLAASRLPQALAQVGRWLSAALAAGQLGSDDGTDPACAVSGARIFLSDARGSAAALAENLSLAQQQLSAVSGQPEPEEQP
ncbi:MAG TPA: hypothetical protein VGJ50_24970 [Streptosporangiaceae bacterium]|jgi:hypothetical protein